MLALDIKSKRLKILLMAVCSLLFSYYLWENNLDAKWGLQDDHEIVDTLGPSQNLKISEFWDALLETEIANPGTALRFRPTYSVLRLSEIFLWGASPFNWYLFRMILFSFFILLSWLIADKYVGVAAGLLFALYILSFEFWRDVMARLGPQENYAAVGTALYILGYVNTMELVHKKDEAAGQSLSNWFLIVTGAFIAMGSKENFLILLVPSVILLIILYRKELLGKISILSLSLILGYGVLIGGVLIVVLSRAKTDMYGRSTALSGRLNMALDGFEKAFRYDAVLFGIAAVTLLLGTLFFFLKKKNDPDRLSLVRGKAGKYLGIAVLVLLGYVSQYVFYNGDWPSQANGRYNFPGALAGPYLLFIIVLLLLDISFLFQKPALWRRGVLLAFSLLLIVLISTNGFYEPLRDASKRNAGSTRGITSLILQISDQMHSHPDSSLLFISSDSMIDLELIESVATFLRTYKVKNNFYVFVDRDSFQNTYLLNSGLGRLTMSRLLDLSSNGSRRKDKFSPLSQFDKNKGCYDLRFSGKTPVFPECNNLATIW